MAPKAKVTSTVVRVETIQLQLWSVVVTAAMAPTEGATMEEAVATFEIVTMVTIELCVSTPQASEISNTSEHHRLLPLDAVCHVIHCS